MPKKIPVADLEGAALQIANDGLAAIDDCLHRNHCFPIIELDRRTIIRNALYMAGRANLVMLANAVKDGADISEAVMLRDQIPNGTKLPPPSPV